MKIEVDGRAFDFVIVDGRERAYLVSADGPFIRERNNRGHFTGRRFRTRCEVYSPRLLKRIRRESRHHWRSL